MNIKTKSDAFKQYNENNDNNENDAKVIRKARIARQLLQMGGDRVRIIDIKPDRLDSNKSVYVFRNDSDFQEVLEGVLEENRRNRENPETADLKKQLEEMQKKLEALSKNTDEKE